MRILFLTQWFQPENFFKGLPFAKALKDRGHDVEVLTGFPNYPGGKLYPGYRIRCYQKEVMESIIVHRVPLYPSHDKSALRRIANYLSFSLSAFLFGPWFVRKPDIIYVYNLVTLGLPAFFLRFLYGAKVIIDVQDLWPESVAGSGILNNKFLLHVLSRTCDWVYRKADQLVVLSQGFKEHLIQRGISPEKITLIYNWCQEIDIRGNASLSDSALTASAQRPFTVLFAGAMGIYQGLDTLLQCAEICLTQIPDVRFILIGGGADRERLEKMASKMKLDNVDFLPPRSTETMGEIYDLADVLIVHLKDQPLFRITIPSKTQAYLYMGKPVIMAGRGDAATLVEQAGAGIACAPDHPDAIMAAIKTLRDAGAEERRKMGEAGHSYYMQNLSFDKGVKNFEETMFSLSGQKH